MDELFELYQEIILDHNKRPRNFRPMVEHTHSADGQNPVCGDEITVYVRMSGDAIEDISFQGEGCAISKASASLMTRQVKGMSIEEATEEFRRVQGMLTGSEGVAFSLEEAGDIASLSGVRRFPARVKCATLAWHALKAALEGTEAISTE
ncbi:MAG: Zinc-dependent sulfurtransferase SufU [Candidatus Moanabacter tarae]|uniref:Zinc-dependent sulfurtransferase SufU n=1 Tax=Candidatus Moanibacter tarae TaxID=2200854 RepID=A0A2Z4AIF1_9BACT|nr:MAG: Zinc-dependent sulfurtransferase SufU [Candidatus Moanabacter tarae]|tara:strand:+ start:82403 stop:82852 length:450 start_codon:yes stop_codon:yes gene_type:complete